MLEDELKKTFEQLNTEPLPRTFGAVDIVHRGETVKRRRRTYAVAAAGTGTAVVAVVIAFALNQPPNRGDHSPAGPPAPDVGTSAPSEPGPATSPEDVASSSVEVPSTTPLTGTTSPGPGPGTATTRATATGPTTPGSTGTEPQQTTTR